MGSKLEEIYREEMRSRIEKLRLALALSGAIDPTARGNALYDAHLQAHTMKGTSEQLKFNDAGALAAVMADTLEHAREQNQLGADAIKNVERGCNAFLTWLDGGQKVSRPLTIATAAFGHARESS